MFTKIAIVVAWIAVVAGVIQITIMILIGIGSVPQQTWPNWTPQRSGERVDRGIEFILFGICLGVGAEISRSLSNKKLD